MDIVGISDRDIKLLRDIANSEETIVRFEGDDYRKDYTIPSSDKKAIREVLEAYDLLK